ncbi:GNAT family N-acetyltransferase [Lentzea sp. NPDC051213]|uniref:GNAT family N-acetyltransferase n=1 Tax=Lentzea sp. NPDC051213 TaxID=3364126 RepID=UPI00378DC12F
MLGASGRPNVLDASAGAGPRAVVRDYEAADEASWLRCRVLGLLETSRYDDVWQSRRRNDLELVAADDNVVIGLLDVSVPGTQATVDMVVVHPGHRRGGVASTLLDEAVRRLERCGVRELDARVREDAPALGWFARHGFVETERHLHVHASADEVGTALTARYGLEPVGALLHARIEREAEMRQRFERVYVCRRLVRVIS